jgi:hypothetical protein
MISFRLTAEEYRRFCELCLACGAKSVSELARNAINSLLQQPAQVPKAIEYRVSELEDRLNILNVELNELSHQHGVQPPKSQGGSSIR